MVLANRFGVDDAIVVGRTANGSSKMAFNPESRTGGNVPK